MRSVCVDDVLARGVCICTVFWEGWQSVVAADGSECWQQGRSEGSCRTAHSGIIQMTLWKKELEEACHDFQTPQLKSRRPPASSKLP